MGNIKRSQETIQYGNSGPVIKANGAALEARADGADASLVPFSAAGLPRVSRLSLAFGDTGDNNIGDALPAGATVLGALIDVGTAFDGSAQINIGDATVADRIVADADVTETGTGTTAVWKVYTYAAATQLIVNLGGSPTQGVAEIVVLWACP